jgi:ADP-heptose:LPS heptosyltransferase
MVGRSEDALAARYIMESTDGAVRNFVGKTSLFEYVEIIASASVVICNESSAYHIAVAHDRSVLCLLGGGHYGLFAPYPESKESAASSLVVTNKMSCFGCNWKCRFDRGQMGAFRCVESIELEDAIAGFEMLFAGVSKRV